MGFNNIIVFAILAGKGRRSNEIPQATWHRVVNIAGLPLSSSMGVGLGVIIESIMEYTIA